MLRQSPFTLKLCSAVCKWGAANCRWSFAACATPEPKAMVHKKRSKEYFSETDYGVKASPYVGNRKLVGRDQLGKP